jgi:endoglycosylceramidase
VSAEAKWRRDRFVPYDASMLERMRTEFGMNTVRLLVFWEALEPYPGLYDDAYIDAIRSFVEAAGRYDMHVIIDMHQDVYGRGFEHAGAPWWSCDPELYSTYVKREPWFLGYLQLEVGACFDTLYSEGPTRSAFYAAWAKLASALRGADAVLAYDLLNEPFWGSTSVRTHEREVLVDFYRGVIDVIRGVDPEPWVLVEPAPTSNLGLSSELAPLERERVLYGPHFYPTNIELHGVYEGSRQSLRKQLRTLCSDARRLDMPLVVGEFGVRRNVRGASQYLNEVYDVFDEAKMSALYWSLERGGESSYGMLDRQSQVAMQGRRAARPYPGRIAGTSQGWRWDAEQGIFTARWDESTGATGETRIALPELAFPEKIQVELQGEGSHRIENAVLHIPRVGGERKIVVRRRPAGWQPPRAGDAGIPDGGPDGSTTTTLAEAPDPSPDDEAP